MSKNETLNKNYFDDVYTRNDDPWRFETSKYEKDKYQATLDSLTRASYSSAFEIGCSIGVFSERLALICERLLCVDISDLPLEKARIRLQPYGQVTVKKMAVPEEFPADNFDLIILSEVGYYWTQQDLERSQQLIFDHLAFGGDLILVHWTPAVPDYPLTGDQVHDSFALAAKKYGHFSHLSGKREEQYRLDVYQKT